MPMPDALRTWLRLGEISAQVMPMLLFSLGGRPANKKNPERKTTVAMAALPPRARFSTVIGYVAQ
jgi:hypothetical protein